jgi:putative endonuclease
VNKKTVGDFGEQVAEEYIVSRGYRVVYKNWRCKYGEIDLVAYDAKGCLVFIEVKTCSQREILPYENFTRLKQAHLMRAINIFFQNESEIRFNNWRLDLITVESKINHIKHVQS